MFKVGDKVRCSCCSAGSGIEGVIVSIVNEIECIVLWEGYVDSEYYELKKLFLVEEQEMKRENKEKNIPIPQRRLTRKQEIDEVKRMLDLPT